MPSRNIFLLYLIKLSKWFMLYMPISYLYYLENDFSELEYLSLHAIYSGVIAFLEVPSGYVADVWGRKQALMIGTLFGVLGFATYSISAGLAFFLVAEILLGIGQSLISGADSALLYDSLLERKMEKTYIKHEGNITALGNIAEVAASLFVSIIILAAYRQYFYIQIFVAIGGFAATFFLIEPKIHEKKLSGSFNEIIDVVKHVLLKNKKLRNLILYSSVIGFASLSMAWLTQPILKEIGLKENNFGYAWAALNLLVALGSLTAIRLLNKLKFVGSLLLMGIVLSLGYFFVGIKISLLSFIPLAIFYYVRGTAHPILKKYINELTSSEKRATVLSIRSLIIRMFFLIMGPLLGYMSEKISLQFALVLCGVSVLFPAMAAFFFLVKGYKRN